jgi:hypothetical protein
VLAGQRRELLEPRPQVRGAAFALRDSGEFLRARGARGVLLQADCLVSAARWPVENAIRLCRMVRASAARDNCLRRTHDPSMARPLSQQNGERRATRDSRQSLAGRIFSSPPILRIGRKFAKSEQTIQVIRGERSEFEQHCTLGLGILFFAMDAGERGIGSAATAICGKQLDHFRQRGFGSGPILGGELG